MIRRSFLSTLFASLFGGITQAEGPTDPRVLKRRDILKRAISYREVMYDGRKMVEVITEERNDGKWGSESVTFLRKAHLAAHPFDQRTMDDGKHNFIYSMGFLKEGYDARRTQTGICGFPDGSESRETVIMFDRTLEKFASDVRFAEVHDEATVICVMYRRYDDERFGHKVVRHYMEPINGPTNQEFKS